MSLGLTVVIIMIINPWSKS